MIEIQSLGGIGLTDATGSQVRLRSRKHVGLLLYLAMSPRRKFRREQLVSLFWSSPPERARHSLSQAVYDLRSHLAGALLRGPGEQLSLDDRDLSFDAIEFEAAIRDGRLARAIELYRGPFAQNLTGAGTAEFDRWVETERIRLGRLAEVALRRYAAECESKGRWGEMCLAAMRLVDLAPLDEEAHLALMRGLWLHGDPTSALKHYDSAAQLLRNELPDGPPDSLNDLADRIRSAPSANPVENRVAERDTPFLGRDAEFDTLRAAFHGMGRSRTTAVLIAGEAGIGKSRLVREFARSMALQDVRLIESRCYPAEEELPYGPIIDAISPIAREILAFSPDSQRFARLGYLLPEFPRRSIPEDEGVDPAAWRRRLYEEVASLLRLATEDTPIVWIIDDAQWIDATSAGLLHYVSRRLEGARFLLAVTVRAPRVGKLPSKLPVTPPDGSGYTQEIRLPPLTDDQIRELVLHGRPDAADHPAVAIAQRLSAGNPFYAMEVFMAARAAAEWAQTMSEWDPLNDERLKQVLAVRFKGLAPGATRLLQSVAVLERNATPTIVASVSGIELDEAANEGAELYARGLIHDDENRLDFVNDIMRDYVYSQITGIRRTALHRRAGFRLENEPHANPGTLARHFHLGEERVLAYGYAMQAAQEASMSGGHAEAAAMAGLARTTASTVKEELAALEIMAESELASAQLSEARGHYAEIIRLQPDMPAETKIRYELKMVECFGAESDWRSAISSIRDLAPLFRLMPKGNRFLEMRIEANAWVIRAATRLNDHDLAQKHLRRIQRQRQLAVDCDNPSQVADVAYRQSHSGYELFFGSLSKALELIAPLATDPGTKHLRKDLTFRTNLLLSSAHLKAAEHEKAEHFGRVALQLAIKAGDLVQQANALNNLTCIALEAGDWESADSRLYEIREKLDALAAAYDATLPLQMNTANIRFYRGQAREALDLFTRCRSVAQANGIIEFDQELLACMGLAGLQVREFGLADSCFNELRNYPAPSLLGMQERFKVDWFLEFMRIREGEDRQAAASRLSELAALYLDKDRLESAKLAWLSYLFSGSRDGDATAGVELEKLSKVGLRWFGYFSRRWQRHTLGW